jgi:hypothetical protein
MVKSLDDSPLGAGNHLLDRRPDRDTHSDSLQVLRV